MMQAIGVFTLALILAVGLTTGPAYSQNIAIPGFDQPDEQQYVKVYSVPAVQSAEAGKTCEAATVVDIEAGWHINSAFPHQDWIIPAELEFDSIPGISITNLTYPPGQDRHLAGENLSVYDGRVIIRYSVTIASGVSTPEVIVPIRLTFQPCNDRECRPPQTMDANLTIPVGAQGKPVHEEIFAAASEGAGGATPSHPVQPDSELQRLIDKYGFWGYILALGLAFITGLLLSFSPCTYPMIPITVSIFAGQERTVGRGFVLSLFYVGSMAVVYGVMGLIVSLVGGVFGAWLASPAVVIGIAVIFVVFSLSMFGLYELQVPIALRQKLGTTKTGGGVGGAIILGIVAALVVSPCVGPFVAGILLYVATHGSPVFGFITLFVFALGLGTLFILIGTFSSAINALPGAGAWMVSVKKFFGFILLLMALYFLRTIISPTLIAVLTGLLLLAFAIFGGGLDRLTEQSAFFARLKKFLGILALLLGIYLILGTIVMHGFILPPAATWLPVAGVATNADVEASIPWETDLEAGLARAKAENKPVLIDTWATWCVNCKVLDRKTFSQPEVIAEAAGLVPIKVQLETAGTPITQAFMKRFNLKHYSLPTTVLLDSNGDVKRILQGVVGPEDMIEEIRRLH